MHLNAAKMGFIYSFVALNETQLQRRRQLLDFYASLAQFSALIPLLAIYGSTSLLFLSRKIFHSGSSSRLNERQSPKVSKFVRPRASFGAIRWRRLNWYLDGDFIDGRDGWGTKREWAIAGTWMLWLLILVFASTGDGTLESPSLDSSSILDLATISLILFLLSS